MSPVQQEKSQTSNMEAELLSAEVSDREDDLGLAENQYMEDMAGNRRNAKMERGREKPTAKGEVTLTAGSGSQAPDREAKLLSAEANYRLRAMKILAKSEAEEKVVPMKEAVDCSPSSEMEGGYVLCEIGGEQQPVRVKAPPQKIRAVIGAESAEAQDRMPCPMVHLSEAVHFCFF